MVEHIIKESADIETLFIYKNIKVGDKTENQKQKEFYRTVSGGTYSFAKNYKIKAKAKLKEVTK